MRSTYFRKICWRKRDIENEDASRWTKSPPDTKMIKYVQLVPNINTEMARGKVDAMYDTFT